MNIYLSLIFAAVAAFGAWQHRAMIADADLLTLRLEYSQAREEAAADARKKEQVMQQATAEIDALNADLTAERERKNRVIYKEVISYVKSPDIERCNLPDDFVRIHEAAATGIMPDDPAAASGSDDQSRTFTDAELIEVVADNYLSCRAVADRLSGLQEWVKLLGMAK